VRFLVERASARTPAREHQVKRHYTLAETVSTSFPNSPRRVRQAQGWPAWAAELPGIAALAARATGETIVDHRSSWVRRVHSPVGPVFVKTYEYTTWTDRLRNFGRRTGPFADGRARREFDALQWQLARGLQAPEPLAVYEWRRLGWLWRAVLVTAAWPGESAAVVLPSLPPDARPSLAAAIGRHLRTLHRLGFRDRNYDLRNLLVARQATGWVVAKVDSPRFQLRRPDTDDALARADWSRLLPQLDAMGLSAAALAASETTQP
jgi:hypothetical protein